jgi:LL-diaminopimelate aminotransferase
MKSKRLLALPPYLFEDLENRFRRAVSSGRDVINLSVGDPDLDPPASLIGHLEAASRKNRYHRYPPQRGLPALKEAVRRFLARHHGVEPGDDELLILIGSKEGISHLPLAVCNPADRVIIPDPGYPVYSSSALFAGCDPITVPLREENDFFPRFDEIPGAELERARLCFINYPNNPTSAVAGRTELAETLDYMSERGIILANDAAYADIYYDSPPPVLSSLPDALRRPVIEFFSFSKLFCITGWRIGFAVGNRDVIEALSHLKANVDSGVFSAIQEAVALTLEDDGDEYAANARIRFRKRRDTALSILHTLGLRCYHPAATFYTWIEVPEPWKSMEYALMLLEKANVLVTPGIGFGSAGDRFIRIALTCNRARLEEAGERLQDAVRSVER